MAIRLYKNYPNFDEFDSVFEDLSKMFNGMDKITKNSYMNIDLYENENEAVIEAELPGFQRDEININIENNILNITAQKKEAKEEKNDSKKYYIKERYFGKVARAFEMPENIDLEKINAKFENGILKITLAKKDEETKNIKIDIQ
ncbi:Hsp20/alpha crystallin family protein [Oceanotoga sp. DSM 15011]|uniref:Hsp20/alpha crystallin family protein n=1 Tax=Oceanotoga sp. DSM 15011 TaxID=2984951 RepID=UPI0021F486E6|nr:Hsp20/alpha crystallin family protein [Oceanotoga sp. DSM 15011]UYP01147.1 Hsp20/alpha crystallin family protein [Oceanotoga sp. DSM 15011]